MADKILNTGKYLNVVRLCGKTVMIQLSVWVVVNKNNQIFLTLRIAIKSLIQYGKAPFKRLQLAQMKIGLISELVFIERTNNI